MERSRLTRNLQPFKYELGFIGLFCLYITIIYLTDYQTVLIAGPIAIISIFIAYKIHHSAVINFDNENMYLTAKGAYEEIPLKLVTAVKLTSFTLNKMHFWEIFFTDNNGDGRSVTFFPVYKTLGFFMDKVKEKNPSAETNNSIFY
ncbi:hypothetical protein [Mucilaginibacter gotjawali]|uniref:Uncharacterized protein n=2 Tax=Mucilaginibacter gotjawali TaxID=1550579 RepID=A0A839SKF1_9SPHI|nr:hypothetical protein [Mucilaginibacter gotjawali]MBB3057888.1 hypothetical protein [Mucilaginibacter gotjawali]BAU52340.1 hypothetical protein MgSA37_00495 [Mucilaginibacter gotjawali]